WWSQDRRAESNLRTAKPEAPELATSQVSAEWLAANADLLPRPAGSNSALAPPLPAPSLSLSAWLMLLWATIAAALVMRFVWDQWKWQRRFAAAPALDLSALPL